jgi:diguanylate cyclase (GGDEF)-like protein/PAS domain S-box-containing protein
MIGPDAFQSLVENADEIIALVDDVGRVSYVNRAAEVRLGYDRRTLIGRVGFDFIHPDDVNALVEQFLQTATSPGARAQMDVRARDVNGAWHWLELVQTNLLGDSAVGAIVISCRDITSRKRAHEFLADQALHDPLTRLPNRLLLHDRLALSLARAERDEHSVAVVFIDLDRFKDVNDRYGHVVGDALLNAVATRLRERLREGDTVARWGGDEFVVTAEIHPAASNVLLNRLEGVFADPFELPNHTISVAASIGLALAHSRRDVDELLREADNAMYRAKARDETDRHG